MARQNGEMRNSVMSQRVYDVYHAFRDKQTSFPLASPTVSSKLNSTQTVNSLENWYPRKNLYKVILVTDKASPMIFLRVRHKK